MREDHDRRRFGEPGEVLLKPGELLDADFRLRPRDIVQRHEVHATVIERVMGLSEEFAVKRTTVESSIVLTRDTFNERYVHLFGNVLELLHALRVNVAIFGVVREIAGEQNKVRTLRQSVDHVDCALECLGAERVGRPIEANVCIAELNKREWRYFLAIVAARG